MLIGCYLKIVYVCFVLRVLIREHLGHRTLCKSGAKVSR
jgi:hypothetical protein